MVLNNLIDLITIKSIKDTTGATLSSYNEINALDFLGGKVGASGAGYTRAEIGTNGNAVAPGNYLPITTNVNISRTSMSAGTPRENGEVINLTCTFENIGATDVIIKEIGLTIVIDASGNKDVLLTRKVLNSPITMGPGSVYQFIYSLKMNTSE